MRKEFTIRTKDCNGRHKEIKAKIVVHNPAINPGTSHKWANCRAEYIAQHLSGQNTGMGIASNRQFNNSLKHFSKNMEIRQHITSWAVVKVHHVRKFEHDMKALPSLLSGKKLDDGTIKKILVDVRRMLATKNMEHMMKGTYADKGLAVAHSDRERPIDFKPGWEVRREAYQDKLDGHRNPVWGEMHRFGKAMLLRDAEKVESRDTIKVTGSGKDKRFFATNCLGPFKEVTRKRLQELYGKTCIKRAVKMQPGKEYLIAEHCKGNRTRFVEITDGARREAVSRLHGFINSRSGHNNNKKVYPDQQSTKNAENGYSTTMTRYGGNKDAQLHGHADRHWAAQQLYIELRTSGLSREEARAIISEILGHSDPRKADYYIPKHWA